MKILVCLSIVPDTTTNIRFNSTMDSLDTTGIQWIINPWDELALTRSLEIREQTDSGVSQVTVVHVGLQNADPVIQKALAVGADSAIRVNYQPADAMEVAVQIAEIISKNDFDLVIAGHDSADYNGSAAGEMLAEILGWTSFSAVSSLSISSGGLIIEREGDSLTETIRAQTPCVLTIQKGIARDPRIPALRGIMMARSKPLTVAEPAASGPVTRIRKFDNPAPRSKCRMVDPSNVEELVSLLRNEANVL